MKSFLEPVKQLNAASDIISGIKCAGRPIMVSGCVDSDKAHLVCGLTADEDFEKKVNEKIAEKVAEKKAAAAAAKAEAEAAAQAEAAAATEAPAEA